MNGLAQPQPPRSPLNGVRRDGVHRGAGDGIRGWQRAWIVLAVMMVLPAIEKVSATPLRVMLTAVALSVVLAAMGVVELLMALWYRARRRRHR